MKFQKFEISFLIFGSILVVVFNVILVALKVLVVFEIFKETSNKFAVKFLSSRTVRLLLFVVYLLCLALVDLNKLGLATLAVTVQKANTQE